MSCIYGEKKRKNLMSGTYSPKKAEKLRGTQIPKTIFVHPFDQIQCFVFIKQVGEKLYLGF